VIRGIGIDIVEISRVRDALAEFGPRFVERVFTRDEHAYCAARSDAAASYAVRWAAKEAFAKAARLTPAPRWTDLEVVMRDGRPSLAVSDALAARLGPHTLQVSLAHGREEAVAVVLLISP
jgi:holo-[acyl-carrier protein] synthase